MTKKEVMLLIRFARFAVLLALLLVLLSVYAQRFVKAYNSQRLNPELRTKLWSAQWIAVPNTLPFSYGIYNFRRTFELKGKPSSFVVHATADNRYELFVNGERVVSGPARGDLSHWQFETIDIAPHLRVGKNVLAAVVWNFGEYAPEAQVTNRTAFLLQGDSRVEMVADTGSNWRCTVNRAYQPLYYSSAEMRGYFVTGPGDRVNGMEYPWGWEQPDFDDSSWVQAESNGRSRGAPRGVQDAPNRWELVPREVPLMEEKAERLQTVRQASGIDVPKNFPQQSVSFTIPANTKMRLLLDQSYLTTAYPELVVSGGQGSVIKLGYAESLFAGEGRNKGNRNEVEGKTFIGLYDIFITDGGASRLFRPLWWRTYRYVDLQVETKDQPLTINDFRGIFTAYPFQMKAKFDARSDRVNKILEVGWRTARLDAHETYMDCPYYEQLQYAGDTRIQALVSFYNSGDTRLAKNAIAQLNDSRIAEGITMSRAPTRQQQYIAPFSLWWIGMVHDYWMYQDDPEFVREMLPGVRQVLNFYGNYQKTNGSLEHMPFWNFVDYTKGWKDGVPPMEVDGSSCSIDLQLLLALDWAADLESQLGSKSQAIEFHQKAARLRKTIRQLYWDSTRELFADTPTKKEFSQQANSLAVLAHVVESDEARSVIDHVLSDSTLTQCTYYFRHYLHSAVNQVGAGDQYLDLLTAWDQMLERGLTTWAEKPEPSRSDCHAWSASPNYELFRTVLGIDSAAPGFKRVIIRPFLGKLTYVSGSIPHPNGEVAVKLERVNHKLNAEVILPTKVTGNFVWGTKWRPLKSGRNQFNLPD